MQYTFAHSLNCALDCSLTQSLVLPRSFLQPWSAGPSCSLALLRLPCFPLSVCLPDSVHCIYCIHSTPRTARPLAVDFVFNELSRSSLIGSISLLHLISTSSHHNIRISRSTPQNLSPISPFVVCFIISLRSTVYNNRVTTNSQSSIVTNSSQERHQRPPPKSLRQNRSVGKQPVSLQGIRQNFRARHGEGT